MGKKLMTDKELQAAIEDINAVAEKQRMQREQETSGRPVTTLKKSVIPINYDPVEGPDIQFHQPLIFMWEGKEYVGINVGWNRAGDDAHYNIKIMPSDDKLYQYMLPSSHLKVLHTHVWRVWDERDDIILRLIKLAGGDLKAQGGYCPSYDIKEIE